MAQLCPYPTCWHEGHLFVNADPDFWPRRFHARWIHRRKPCCEWCAMWKEHAYWFHGNNAFFFQMLPVISDILDAYHIIHLIYKTHSIGEYAIAGHPWGPHNDYGLSYAVECLSQEVWALYKQFPELVGFDKVSEALKDMAIELQIGPPRELYHTMPRL